MSVRELRWWSTTALRAMGAAIEPAWLHWCAAWGVAARNVTAMNACSLSGQLDRAGAVEPVPGAAAWLGSDALSTQDAMSALVFGHMPASAAQETSLAAELAALAWADLLGRLAALVGGTQQAMVVPEPAPPTSDFQHWSGAVTLLLSSSAAAGPGLVLHLSAACAALLVDDGRRHEPSATTPAGPRCSVLEAMQERHISLRIGLDDVLLDVATLVSLRCGDVLTLPQRLDQVLHVRVVEPEGDITDPDICAAVLGARTGRRAVELVGLPTIA